MITAQDVEETGEESALSSIRQPTNASLGKVALCSSYMSSRCCLSRLYQKNRHQLNTIPERGTLLPGDSAMAYLVFYLSGCCDTDFDMFSNESFWQRSGGEDNFDDSMLPRLDKGACPPPATVRLERGLARWTCDKFASWQGQDHSNPRHGGSRWGLQCVREQV